jgi:phosphoglycolate phosphatase
MIDHIIFDLDGTLVDSVAICADILNEMLADRGSARQLCSTQVSSFVSLGGAPMVAALLGQECGDPFEEIAEFRRRYAERPTPSASLFQGVGAGLLELHALGFGLSICSNKPQNLCEKVLGDLNIAPFFDAVVGATPDLRPKPAPDLMHLTLKLLGTTPDRCLFVGDSELDHGIAEASGVPFLLVDYGYADQDWDFGNVLRFGRFSELVGWIGQTYRTMPSYAVAGARWGFA